ncbi:TPA: hypothetical protein DDW35_05910 [Candidatus Sumerlaeota bacterium]|nr:hypothetical protein [Candidatus Sumerlaeota bacterium]
MSLGDIGRQIAQRGKYLGFRRQQRAAGNAEGAGEQDKVILHAAERDREVAPAIANGMANGGLRYNGAMCRNIFWNRQDMALASAPLRAAGKRIRRQHVWDAPPHPNTL